MCPLARIVRRELKKDGVTGVKAIYSEEPPEKIDRSAAAAGEKICGQRQFRASVGGAHDGGARSSAISFTENKFDKERIIMENFEYCTPTRVLFGKGQVEELPARLAAYGKKVLPHLRRPAYPEESDCTTR